MRRYDAELMQRQHILRHSFNHGDLIGISLDEKRKHIQQEKGQRRAAHSPSTPPLNRKKEEAHAAHTSGDKTPLDKNGNSVGSSSLQGP